MRKFFTTLCAISFGVLFAAQSYADLDFCESPYKLTDTERQLVEQIVACEDGAGTIDGQMMIAQCLLDYANDNDLDITSASNALQIYTYTREVTQENKDVVSAVFDVGERVTDEHAYWWYNPNLCTSRWHESQQFVYEVDGHRFFGRW